MRKIILFSFFVVCFAWGLTGSPQGRRVIRRKLTGVVADAVGDPHICCLCPNTRQRRGEGNELPKSIREAGSRFRLNLAYTTFL